jgi:glyoxylase-like metal-dependent hydrolase (beta-lactamase superfamily II)
MKKISIDDFRAVYERFPNILFYRVNTRCCSTRYLIKDNNRILLIDSGDGQDELDFTPDICILTHGHYDHVGGIKSDWPEVYIYKEEDPELPYVNIPENVQRLDSDKFTFGSYELEVHSSPGHTLGCISIFEPKSKILFSGDTKFAQGSYGRTDLGGSEKKIQQSLKMLDSLDWEILCPGHGKIEYRDGRLI